MMGILIELETPPLCNHMLFNVEDLSLELDVMGILIEPETPPLNSHLLFNVKGLSLEID